MRTLLRLVAGVRRLWHRTSRALLTEKERERKLVTEKMNSGGTRQYHGHAVEFRRSYRTASNCSNDTTRRSMMSACRRSVTGDEKQDIE